MVTVAVRLAVRVFAEYEYSRIAVPVPLRVGSVSQLALLVADHAQPRGVVSVTAPVPEPAPTMASDVDSA
jgi:hypothetical protein